MAGKGSVQRPTDMHKYRANWERIFGKKKSDSSPAQHQEKPNSE